MQAAEGAARLSWVQWWRAASCQHAAL